LALLAKVVGLRTKISLTLSPFDLFMPITFGADRLMFANRLLFWTPKVIIKIENMRENTKCHCSLEFLIRFSVLQNVLCRCQIWQCEFCEEQNVVDILAEEIPTEADVTYMISPAPATTATSCLGDENSMVVFCIDVSGSMGGHVSCFLSSFLVFSAKKCKPLEARCNTKLKKCPYIVDCWWENVCNENFYIF